MKSKTGQRQILAILNLSGASLQSTDSLADQLEKAAGTEVAAWVREAIAEKLEREYKQKAC